MRLILLLLALIVAAAIGKSPKRHKASRRPRPAALEKGVDRSHKGIPAPDTVFHDRTAAISALPISRAVLVNLWATWCAPCVKELPTLDKLAAHAIDGQIGIIAVSQDMAPQGSVSLPRQARGQACRRLSRR